MKYVEIGTQQLYVLYGPNCSSFNFGNELGMSLIINKKEIQVVLLTCQLRHSFSHSNMKPFYELELSRNYFLKCQIQISNLFVIWQVIQKLNVTIFLIGLILFPEEWRQCFFFGKFFKIS